MRSQTTRQLVSPPTGDRNGKEAQLARLRRIEGQVRGIHRMVSEDLYCIDILTQISAIKQALNSVGVALLDEHVHHCVADAIRSDDVGAAVAKLDEVSAVITRMLRS